MYSDAYNTIASVGILFAVEEMGMKNSDVAILAAISPLMAALGIIFFRVFQVRFNYTSKTMILITLTMVTMIPAYGLLGFSEVFGVVHTMELYGVIVWYGFVLGAIQSSTRSAYTDIIPPGQESEFFGIYEISDKGSSWMGPLICGVLYETTGSMRVGFVYLLLACLIGLVLVYKTDFVEGSEACRRKEIQVRMEAVRNKMGVSKIQIQMNAKKFIGLKSSTAGSSASSVGPKSEGGGGTQSVHEASHDPETPHESSHDDDVGPDGKPIISIYTGEKRSVLEKKVDDMTFKDVDNMSVEGLLQKAQILEVGQTLDTLPRRKSNAFSYGSRTGFTGDGHFDNDGGGAAVSGKEKSVRSTRQRKTSVLVAVSEVLETRNEANIGVSKMMSNKVFASEP